MLESLTSSLASKTKCVRSTRTSYKGLATSSRSTKHVRRSLAQATYSCKSSVQYIASDCHGLFMFPYTQETSPGFAETLAEA